MIKPEDWKEIGELEDRSSEGVFGIRILLASSNPNIMEVFDYDNTRPTPKSFVSVSQEMGELLEKIQMAYTGLDPTVAEKKLQSRNEIAGLFTSAGLTPIYIQEVPNEYCPRHCCVGTPWFAVTSSIGVIKVGWRKRVLNVDYSGTEVTTKAEKLFPKEEVTRFERTIHAWSPEDAVRYLKEIAGARSAITR